MVEQNKDLPKIKVLEREIRNFKNRLDAIAECTPGSLYWKDSQGRYIGCNHYMVSIAKLCSREDLIGKNDFELWPEQADLLVKNDQQVMRSGKTSKFKEVVNFPDGSVKIFAVVKMPLRDANNEIVGVVGNSLEITDRENAEKERLRAEKAESKLVGMRTLAYGIAHELRTPLATLSLGFDEIKEELMRLKRVCEENSQLSRVALVDVFNISDFLSDFANMEFCAHRAGRIVDLILVNVDTGGLSNLQLTNLSALDCIHNELSHYPFVDDLEFARVTVKDKEDFIFKGDKVYMGVLIANLIKNALHYTAKQGSIVMWCECSEGKNALHIRDTGTGISSEIKSEIFDHGVSNTPHGNGIGLSMCRIIMQSFGGEIECFSELGKFTEFVMQFPSIK